MQLSSYEPNELHTVVYKNVFKLSLPYVTISVTLFTQAQQNKNIMRAAGKIFKRFDGARDWGKKEASNQQYNTIFTGSWRV